MGCVVSLIFDSFKGSIGAVELGAALQQHLRSHFSDVEFVNFPCSDGGDGFVSAVAYHVGGETVECEVADPLLRPRTARYVWNATDRVAIVESAQANGLALLKKEELDPLKTTTYGVGELLLDAERRGAKRIIIGVGGSATVDGGLGMAQALGFGFTTPDDRQLGPWMEAFEPDVRIVPPEPHPLADVRVEVACDVRTRLLGPRETSAIWVYGPQKGGTEESLALIERCLTRLDDVIRSQFRKEYGGLAMGGAAGGLAAGLAAFAGARLCPGMELFDELTGLRRQIEGSALAVTGEGRLDRQSAEGKVVSYVSALARAAGIPVIALCGSAGEHNLPLDGVVALTDSGMPVDDCIARPLDALAAVLPRLVETIRGAM